MRMQTIEIMKQDDLLRYPGNTEESDLHHNWVAKVGVPLIGLTRVRTR